MTRCKKDCPYRIIRAFAEEHQRRRPSMAERIKAKINELMTGKMVEA